MSIHTVADINFEIQGSLRFMRHLREEYASNETKGDFIIDVPEKFSGNLDEEGVAEKNDIIQRSLARKLSEYDAILLHAATFDIKGNGVAFSALSGTGKTTHMNLWQRLLGDRMTVVNGDKPIVRFFDDEPETPYAYGTPWNGKERLGCNMRTPLKHICFIERAKENFVEKMDPKEAIDRIFNQVYMPKDPVAVMKTMELINRLIHSCNLWKIHCNMNISAAETAYNTIFKEK